ncbi:unnamed protein product [Caenorhabditis auriculariae]|uniref:m7GpppX diphosphatase n=1 Tax=Caenorhabditis auriculariae TaxID=2777116 RepID=A0A8S1HFX8_9PELO|nr:unnamed protein product [Caenorhabditis auriculariae]
MVGGAGRVTGRPSHKPVVLKHMDSRHAANGVSPLEQRSIKNTEELSREWLKLATFSEILASDSSHKCIFVLLSHPSGERGILIANKSAFAESQEAITLFLKQAHLKELTKNDIFGNYEITVAPEFNVINSQLIYPVNDRLIAKYRQEEKFVIAETPESYVFITLPYIEKNQMNLTWVYNLLQKEAEEDRIIFEDVDKHNGFVLALDIKWDGKTLENLYLQAIVHRRGIKSIRDLTDKDVDLLENIRSKSLKAIKEKYGVRPDQMRMYFHYQPSFYHLHVHFVSIKYDAPASTTLCAVLLDDVINNLKLNGQHYQKSTLTFMRKNTDELLRLYRSAGVVQSD